MYLLIQLPKQQEIIKISSYQMQHVQYLKCYQGFLWAILILHFICPKAYETGQQESWTEQEHSLKAGPEGPCNTKPVWETPQTPGLQHYDEEWKYLGREGLWASILLRKDADIVPCYKTTVSTTTVCFPGTSHNYLVEKTEQLNVPCALYAVNKLACTTGTNLETITVLRNRKQAHANISEYMTKHTH